MRAQGGRGKHIQICLCLAQSALRVTTELGRRYRVPSYHQTRRGSASVAVRVEKRANKNVKIRLLFSETETAKQNQKFPFHFFFRFAAEGWGRRREKNARKFFGFCTRESASVSEARIIGRQGSIQNTFELRSIHTAIFRKGFLNANLGRREAPTLMHSPRRIQNPKGFSTLRVARRLPIQIYE